MRFGSPREERRELYLPELWQRCGEASKVHLRWRIDPDEHVAPYEKATERSRRAELSGQNYVERDP